MQSIIYLNYFFSKRSNRDIQFIDTTSSRTNFINTSTYTGGYLSKIINQCLVTNKKQGSL